jgi:hypothetical protein
MGEGRKHKPMDKKNLGGAAKSPLKNARILRCASLSQDKQAQGYRYINKNTRTLRFAQGKQAQGFRQQKTPQQAEAFFSTWVKE